MKATDRANSTAAASALLGKHMHSGIKIGVCSWPGNAWPVLGFNTADVLWQVLTFHAVHMVWVQLGITAAPSLAPHVESRGEPDVPATTWAEW